jgi:hypothetical protein
MADRAKPSALGALAALRSEQAGLCILTSIKAPIAILLLRLWAAPSRQRTWLFFLPTDLGHQTGGLFLSKAGHGHRLT